MEEEKKLEVDGKKAVGAAGLGEGRRVLGRRKGQAGQNYRLTFPKLPAERPARGRPEWRGGWWWRAPAGLRTRTRASVRLVHTAISSRVLMSG